MIFTAMSISFFLTFKGGNIRTTFSAARIVNNLQSISFFINKDGTPTISQREIGYYKDNKKEGVFKSFLNNPDDDTDIDYTISYFEYKNDWLVKDKDGKFPKKVNEKVIPEEIKKISR